MPPPSAQSVHKLEFWADSFHEGSWICENLKKHLELISEEYLDSFVPKYRFAVSKTDLIDITVFGSYRAWKPLPPQVSELLNWGKPDIIVYDPTNEKIVLAIEETAAVPTGNQALQRCERQYGGARCSVPFWYLLPEYGMHPDGRERRDSIWPTVFAFKLTAALGLPNIVVHFAEEGKPEAYDAGTGVQKLIESLIALIKIHVGLCNRESFLPLLQEQYGSMAQFLKSQWKNITNVLPGHKLLDTQGLPASFANRAIGKQLSSELAPFLVWKNTSELEADELAQIRPNSLIKQDKFLESLEQLVGRSVYTLSENAGASVEPKSKVENWIRSQKRLANFDRLVPQATFLMRVEDFPPSKKGSVYLTTSRNTVYLCDRWGDVVSCLLAAYPRLKGLRSLYPEGKPVVIYVSNSLVPGRIFADPFTGQLSTYAFVFGRDSSGTPERIVVSYYPHQVHNQLFKTEGQFKANKGITLMTELADLAVFTGGIAVDLKSHTVY